MYSKDRILFMIIDDQVKYYQGIDKDHREWYLSLGLDPNNFNNIIRGFISDGKIVFYKGENFNYDDEVMSAAKAFAPSMRITLNNLNLEVWCGVLIDGYNVKWEPIVRINDTELTGFIEKKEEPKEKKEVVERPREAVIDFKNDYDDPAFTKRAILVTIVTLVLTIIIKVILIKSQKMYTSNRGDSLLMILQIGLLAGSLYGYIAKKKFTKYLGIGAGISLLLMFDPLDIILGILYLVYSIDEAYYVKAHKLIKDLINKVSSKK